MLGWWRTLLSTQVIGAIAGLALLLALLCYLRRPRPTVPAAKGSGGDGDGEDGTPGKAPRRRPPHIAFVSRLQAWSASLAHFALPALRALYRNSNNSSSSSSSSSSEMNIMPTELRRRMAAATVAAGGERQDRESGVSSLSRPARRVRPIHGAVPFGAHPPWIDLPASYRLERRGPHAPACRTAAAIQPLRLVPSFSTDQHGCSLRTLYNRVEGRDGTLLVVLDGQGQIFGAFVSEPWQPSFIGQRAYFGNGETFVYRVDQSEDTAITYGWTMAAKPPLCAGGCGERVLWLVSRRDLPRLEPRVR